MAFPISEILLFLSEKISIIYSLVKDCYCRPELLLLAISAGERGDFLILPLHVVLLNYNLIIISPSSGTGTGGTSIWDKEFEDEFHPTLKHDRPYTLSMANADGPRQN